LAGGIVSRVAVGYNAGMTWPAWLTENWFTGVQTVAIVSGLIFTCVTLKRDERSRRVANLFQLTHHHNELWAQALTKPELRRVMSMKADLSLEPVTEDETLFVGSVILNLNSAHYAIKRGMMDSPHGLGADIRTFFAHPVPRAVWTKLRHLQDTDFVAFVEGYFDKGKS